MNNILQNETKKVSDIKTMKQKKKNIKFQNNFNPIEEAIQVYIDFMKKTLDDYQRLEVITNKNIDTQVNDLDVR